MTDKKDDENKGLVPYREPSGGDAVKAFIPNDFSSVFRFAELLAESGDMVPKAYIGNPAKISTAIFFGYEIGLLPLQALQSIAVINGKPSIYGDAALALVRASGLLEDFEEIYEGDMFDGAGKPNSNYKAICKVTRKGAKRATVSEFSIGEAMLANLWNKEGPWRNYAKRMLKMRARGFALRDEFTDILRGLVLAEEAQDYDDMVDVTPTDKSTPPAPETDADENNSEGKPKRGRPKKVDQQAAAAAIANTDGKTIDGTVERGAAGEAKTAETKTTETVAAGKAKPAETKADDGIPALLKILPNFRSLSDKLRAYITDMHATMSAITERDALKQYWQLTAFKGWTPDSDPDKAKIEDAALKAVLADHKDRITATDAAAKAAGTTKTAGGDNPPDPDAAEETTFDFDGWLTELATALAACRSPDEVTKVYGDFTEIPFANNLIGDEQMEKVSALAAEHMRRVEF